MKRFFSVSVSRHCEERSDVEKNWCHCEERSDVEKNWCHCEERSDVAIS